MNKELLITHQNKAEKKVDQVSSNELDPRRPVDYIITVTRSEIPPQARTVIDVLLGDIGNAKDILVSSTKSTTIEEEKFRRNINPFDQISLIDFHGFAHGFINYKNMQLDQGYIRIREDYNLCQRFDVNSSHSLTKNSGEGRKIAPFNSWPFIYANIVDPLPENTDKGMIGIYGSSNGTGDGKRSFLMDGIHMPLGYGVYVESAWLEQDGLDTILKVSYVSTYEDPIAESTSEIAIIVLS